MLGTYYTFPELLIWIPFITGLIAIFIKNRKSVKMFALLSSIATLVVSVISLCYTDVAAHPEFFYYNNVSYVWMPYIGSSFSVGLDGMGFLLTFLTAFSYPLIFAATYKSEYKNPNAFFALMLLTQAGIMGVFVATDALLFYFFWELALIPIYFLCSRWGGEKRIFATFKFFVYTFLGSLLMLVGIIFVYVHTAPVSADSAHSFSINAFYNAVLSPGQQDWLFWLFFIAFAVKIPIFPFHTWQPDVYEQSNYPSVMVLSGLMVKMGAFGVIRWILPIFPAAVVKYEHLVMVLCIIGLIYASCIALYQNDLKRFVAWSSIAHLGLMSAAIFSANNLGLQGVMLEMLNHGINILALWIVVDIIEKKTGVRKISELSGLAGKSPALAIFLVIIAFANIALPLSNSFVSEFLMLNGLFDFNIWFGVFGTIGIILSAVYMLSMVQRAFFGKANVLAEQAKKMSAGQGIVLFVLVIAILFLGIYPEPVIHLTQSTVTDILSRMSLK
ncbi:MAG TPA: NADH-quinone oxidoreductase subunit M [Hanamia sp.]|jgi:NADH-quinone oxidoreductase subunit M|nr:NADH-quinone oxidoreductase subunit M [Hanamia sp.]